jgi:signal transduction histidine kinase/DNA-binding response OmpR family regulator
MLSKALIRASRLNNTSVRRQLSIGFSVVIALLLMVGAAALYHQQQSTSAVNRLIGQDTRVAELILKSNNLLLKARRFEKDFYLSYRHLGFVEAKARYVTFFRVHIADIRANLRDVRQIADSPEIMNKTHELETMLGLYEHGFLTAVDMQSALGHFDAGLAGALRRQAHALEERILKVGSDRLAAGHLTVRRHEKDFMLRERDTDIHRVRDATAALDASISRAPLAAADREWLLQLNNRYLQAFEDYVRVIDAIREFRADYLNAVHAAEPLLEKLHIAAIARVKNARTDILDQGVLATRAVIFASSAAAFIALVIALLVARNVGRSVRDSMQFAEQIAGGRLDSRLALPKQRELTALAAALNTMADALRDSRLAQESRAEELERSVAERTRQLASANSLLTAEIQTRQKTECELQAAKESAEAATTAKSAFLANMSHEIRTPMNGIVGLSQLMMKTPMNESQKEFMGMIHASAHALLRLINDILDVSKMEARKLSLDAIEFDLPDTVADTMKSFSSLANEKCLELAFDLDPDIPARLIGDPGRLTQVLVNLIGNAIKFTSEGEVVVRAALHSIDDGCAKIAFEVADTGIGIPHEKQHHIFEAFTQADTSTTRQYGGTGLGLTIVLEMIRLMQGSIAVNSKPNHGTLFRFIVPLNIAAGQPDRPRVAPLLDSDAAILVVDDNQTSRQILCSHLTHGGYPVQAAATGEEALGLLRHAPPGRTFSVALIDAGMPGMDGFALAAALRAIEAPAIAPVMMLSSNDPSADIEHCRRLGIEHYARKPVRQSDLLDAVAAALCMPLGKAAAPVDEVAQGPATPARVLKVLVAEDHPINQRLIVEILQDRGHIACIADNGREVLDMLDKDNFDVILMDGQMPEMDGYQTTAAIREQEKQTGGHIRIIAVTANAMIQDRDFCLAAGMDDYLSKPIDADQLVARLEQWPQQAQRNTAASLPPPAFAPPSGMAGTLKVFDVDGAMKRVRGKSALLREMIHAFNGDLPESIKTLKCAAQQRDRHTVERRAHKIKGAAAALGADQLAHAAGSIELLGKDGAFGDMPNAITRLEDCSTVLLADLAMHFEELA